MQIFLIIIGLICTLITAFILLAVIRFNCQFHNKRISASVTILSLGLGFDSDTGRPAILIGPWQKIIKSRPPKEKKPKKPKKESTKPFLSLTWRLKWRLARAALLAGGRFFSRLKYEDSLVKASPVMADPALAGITYGFSRAFYGAFPGAWNKFQFTPGFEPGGSNFEGHLDLSIKVRQVAAIGFWFLRDLPIKEIIKQKRSGEVKHAE